MCQVGDQPRLHLRSWGLLLSSVSKAYSIDRSESWVILSWLSGAKVILILLKAENIRSAEAVVVGIVEIRCANLHVCSDMVAILLPYDHCKTSQGGFSVTFSEAKARLILSSAKHFQTPDSVVQSDQQIYTYILYASNFSQFGRPKYFTFFYVWETRCRMCEMSVILYNRILNFFAAESTASTYYENFYRSII